MSFSPGERGGDHPLAAFVDNSETYGPHVIASFFSRIAPYECVLDVGAGGGRDLAAAKAICPSARLTAVDAVPSATLRGVADTIHVLDIEHDRLPGDDESFDVVMANQVLEHTKEIFWIMHEMTRTLRVGGHLIIGVPNVLSLHNRFLMLLGRHPTQHKLYSAHVRPFSRHDTEKFFEVCWPGGYEVEKFSGSQFYPFPRRIARPLARVFPGAAFSVFWLLRKTRKYAGEFLSHPVKA
ncbi:MAG TPA: class I SAM-dependent methyltransferase, partial [Gemmatimonadaceae bacterium]|nr:class I SAM-dependent methyltransferase [Gemmatimonadaceae bacterium]